MLNSKQSYLTKFLSVIIAVTMALGFAGCQNSTTDCLDTAERLLPEQPGSARIMLSRINYSDISGNDNIVSRFAILRALANRNTGRSLLTDTLLARAVEYYESQNDTAQMALGYLLLSEHLYSTGKKDDATAVIERFLNSTASDSLKYELHLSRLILSFREQDYTTSEYDARWLSNHLRQPQDIIFFSDVLMAALYLNGDAVQAVAVGDSAINSPYMPEKYSIEWGDFINDYAYALIGAGRGDDAVNVMSDMMRHTTVHNDLESVSRNLSMAEFQLNVGNLNESEHCISLIDDSIISTFPELVIKKGLLEGIIAYIKTGTIPSNIIQNVPKRINNAFMTSQNDRETVIENFYLVDSEKNKLALQKSRILNILLVLVIIISATAAVCWRIISQKRQKLIDAEERIETLSEMVKSFDDNKPEDKTTILKKLILRQLGVIKSFAEAPTPQNQDALRKISGTNENSDDCQLVDWPNLYAMIDELYDGFHSKLLSSYPETFNNKEVQIIVLLKAGFSTKEIGVLTEQSSNTVYVRKSSIKKKLHTPENGDFMELLDASLYTISIR